MHYTAFIKTGFTLTLAGIAVLGGIQGNALAAQNLADLAAEQRVAAQMVQSAVLQDAYLAGEAQKAIADFQPTLDAATALVASSDGKASAESRAALTSLVTEFETKTTQPFTNPAAYLDAAETAVVTGTSSIAAASQVVTDEVAAWQAAEDARIAAEVAAAEEAARNSGGGYYNDGGGDSGSYSNNSGGSNGGGGGGSRADQWRQIAADNGVHCFSIIPGNVSYYRSGSCIEIAEAPLNAGAERVLWHEIAHHYTMGSGRYDCASLGRSLGGNQETWAQAYTQYNWGWSADWAYAPASQSYIDSMANAGCL